MSQIIPNCALLVQYSHQHQCESGFLSWQLDRLPDIDVLLKQIPPVRNSQYKAIRAQIRELYVHKWTEYSDYCGLSLARILAVIQAQIRIDGAMGIEPNFPLLDAWREKLLNGIDKLPMPVVRYDMLIGYDDADRAQAVQIVAMVFAPLMPLVRERESAMTWADDAPHTLAETAFSASAFAWARVVKAERLPCRPIRPMRLLSVSQHKRADKYQRKRAYLPHLSITFPLMT